MQDIRSRYASLSDNQKKGAQFGAIILILLVLGLIIFGIVKLTKKEGFRMNNCEECCECCDCEGCEGCEGCECCDCEDCECCDCEGC